MSFFLICFIDFWNKLGFSECVLFKEIPTISERVHFVSNEVIFLKKWICLLSNERKHAICSC